MTQFVLMKCSHPQEYWTPNNPMQNTIILLIEQIVVALGGEFKLYLPQLIPHMLRVFMHDNSTGRSVTMKVRGIHNITMSYDWSGVTGEVGVPHKTIKK